MRMVQTIFWIGISVLVGYTLILVLMYLLQATMIYHPQKELIANPQSIGRTYKDVTFRTPDDVQLHGWFIPADSSAPTILYAHGNAGNISGRLQSIQLLNSMGCNVFIFDYRGYGKSEGAPSEEGTYRDISVAWDYLVDQRKVSKDKIVVMGRSLGGSVAAWLAARKDPAAVVIESTFTSAVDLGADLYPWLPVRWLLKFEYKTIDHIKQIEQPLFMAHSRDDQVVPFSHGEQLFEAANEPKTFVELQGGHGSGFWESGAIYSDALRKFLGRYTSLNSKVNN
ncbi:alpha/beta hydrolase [Fodinibius halophilus]|uniref:Alpha/beta fold hydrolase n=1 Tax=Fodinibius halophilus TaxID=1736908 RepID=A0A6M1T519_9BACT|nr:alpha/beta fold hydrolase [Fodinibius halophilus]NGP88345.1 alpha/beta fold hydrolase [Fodinibius halophilus]